MKKLYIIHENNDWMPTIREAMNNYKIPFEEWYLVDNGMVDLTIAPPEGVFFNRVSPSAHTRGHRYSPFYTLAILNWLEAHGRVVINRSMVMNLEISKIAQYNALTQAGIKAPKTMAAFSKEDILKAANKLGFPLITKHNCGGRGSGVRKFTNLEMLKDYLYSEGYEEPIDGINLVQQFIESADKYITRLEFINKKFVYAIRINNEEDFNLCPADSCSIEGSFCATSELENKFRIINNFNHSIIKHYEEFLRSHEIDIAGIEFIMDKNGDLYTYDVNANTNYNSKAEKVAGLSAHNALAEFILALN